MGVLQKKRSWAPVKVWAWTSFFFQLHKHPGVLICSFCILPYHHNCVSADIWFIVICVQATGEQQWCESVAVLLHYLHLVACAWLFSVGVLAYRRLTEGPCPSGQRLHCTLAWLLPATLVLVRSHLNLLFHDLYFIYHNLK